MENTNLPKKEEKIVPLNEDLSGHVQDDISFTKAMKAQENSREALKKLNESKTGI